MDEYWPRHLVKARSARKHVLTFTPRDHNIIVGPREAAAHVEFGLGVAGQAADEVGVDGGKGEGGGGRGRGEGPELDLLMRERETRERV